MNFKTISFPIVWQSAKITSFVHPVCIPSEEEELYVGAKGTVGYYISLHFKTF